MFPFPSCFDRFDRFDRLILLAVLVLLAPTALRADPPEGDCAIGRGLGATMLIPYFEADLEDFDGKTTLVSINNGVAQGILARVVLWTDWGNPTLAFDVYLAPNASTSFNARDLFAGSLPSTGEGVDLSAIDGCGDHPPNHLNPALKPLAIAQLRADHLGIAGPLALGCAGSFQADGIVRGYVTVDVVDQCTGIEAFDPDVTPANRDLPYFANGGSSGVAINHNALWGDWFLVENNAASAQGSSAITLWADAGVHAGLGGSIFTFYGRFHDWDGRDNRVPLPSRWSQRFIDGGPFAGGADVILYHDTGQPPSFAKCGSEPVGFPLVGELTALDSSGTTTVNLNSEFATVGGLATQRVSVSDLAIGFPFGQLQIYSAGKQSWAMPSLNASGIYSASLDATPLGFLCGLIPLSRSDHDVEPFLGRPDVVPGALPGR